MIKQAEHNEQACDYVYSSKRFNDWVVTTAFYSAMYYVYHQIFPLVQNGDNFGNFSSYYLVYKKNKINPNKHTATLELVKAQIPNAYTFYRDLFDLCGNARYHSYVVNLHKARRAKNDLREIKKCLTK